MKTKDGINWVIEVILPKLVITFIVFGLLIFLIDSSMYKACSVFILDKIVNETNISAIITISSVFIGFFATIMTMFASSQNESMTRLINTNKVDLFIQYAKKALFPSIGIMILSLTVNIFIKTEFFPYLYVAVLYYFLASSFRFTYICIKMLGFSINQIKEKQLEEEQKRIIGIKRNKMET